MAHFIIEYSANLKDEIRIQELFEILMGTAKATGVFPLGGIRFRSRCCEEYLIADGEPENAFVHMTVKMGHGRDLETRKNVGEKIFAAFKQHLQPIFDQRPMGISFELTELHPELNFKANNIHERIEQKQLG